MLNMLTGGLLMAIGFWLGARITWRSLGRLGQGGPLFDKRVTKDAKKPERTT